MSGEAQTLSDQPRASTSKDDTPQGLRVSTSTEIIREVAPTTPTIVTDDSNILISSTSSLDRLQTYLPTGTWAMYTALQTWAFSLKVGSAPASATSNCNTHQRIALYIILCLSGLLAFLSSFVKHFVYDSDGVHILYPSPDLFNVAHYFKDPFTGVTFPCRTREKRYCWPLINDFGELKYDDKGGGRIRVMVFKRGIQVHVGRKIWFKRVWKSCFKSEKDQIPEAPRIMNASPSSKHVSLLSTVTRSDARLMTCNIDDVLPTPPPLQPRWTKTLVGALGSKAYLDMRGCVWAHALVSVSAFATLALFSTQVSGCIYPSIPDYLSPTIQTAMLILLGLVAALFIQDDAVSLGQKIPQPVASSPGGEQEVPAYLRPVVAMLVWVPRQDKSER